MIPITESMIPLTIIPDNTNIVIFVFFIRRGINKVSPTAKIPATNAIACTPNEFKCNKIATDAPTHAPEETPRRSGATSGFLNTP